MSEDLPGAGTGPGRRTGPETGSGTGSAIDDETLDLYVLGALDEEDAARVAAALEVDAGPARRAVGTQEALASLGGSVPVEPPPAMRASVLAALDDVAQERPGDEAPQRVEPGVGTDAGSGDGEPLVADRAVLRGQDDPSDELSARREQQAATAERPAQQQPTRRSVMRYAVAAAAVVVAGAGGYAAWSAARAQAQDAVAAARERIDAAPDARVVAASDASGAWAASELRWSPSLGEAVITAPEPLPSASGGVYQLWRVPGAGATPSPVASGGDGSDGGDDARTPAGLDAPTGVVVPGGTEGAAVIAVSRESAPGATSPTTPLVATYPLSA